VLTGRGTERVDGCLPRDLKKIPLSPIGRLSTTCTFPLNCPFPSGIVLFGRLIPSVGLIELARGPISGFLGIPLWGTQGNFYDSRKCNVFSLLSL
jgi:hypothetical protein